MSMLGPEVLLIIALILGMLSLFGLVGWVVRFIAAAIALLYVGFMLTIGAHWGLLFIQAVTQ